MADDDDKVRAYDRHGEKIMISKSEVGKLYALGGKIATKAEGAAHDLEEQYANRSTTIKRPSAGDGRPRLRAGCTPGPCVREVISGAGGLPGSTKPRGRGRSPARCSRSTRRSGRRRPGARRETS